MKPVTSAEITAYVEKNIGEFHAKRLAGLGTLKLTLILKRKNPYLFKAKNILRAQDLVKTLLDAYLSSQEETMFGDFLEGLAIHLCQHAYRGHKSTAEGVDLEFMRDGVLYLVSIKSGPNWGNSSQINRMRDNFRKAKRIVGANKSGQQVVAVNGCCYGRESKPDKGDYLKYCGQEFWAFISGDEELYTRIIDPLGHKAKEKNEQFWERYSQLINRFTLEFGREFCAETGGIDWVKLVRYNSSREQ